jgi:putative MATE family efflux protein
MSIFSSLYTIVDGIFISQFAGNDAFAGVNLVFPYIMILGGIGFMLGSGGTALVSKTLGEKNNKEANSLFSLIIYTAIFLSIILGIVGYITTEPFVRFMASISSTSTEEMVNYAIRYGHIGMVTVSLFILQNVFQAFFVAAEKPKTGFLFILGAGLTNIVLDALLIGVFNLSVEGAALASLAGCAIASIGPIIYFTHKKDLIIHLGKTKFEGKALIKVFSNGLSEFITNISGSIVSMFYNAQLLKYAGVDGVSSYGIIMYISYVFMAIFIGYSIGTSPIVGYNYGSKNKEELHNVFKKSLILIALTGVLMFSLAQLVASPLSIFFAAGNENLASISTRANRIYAFVYLTCGFSMFASAFFTSLNNGLISAIISIVRSLVFELVCVLTLPLLWQVDGVYASAVFAEIGSSLMTIFFFVTQKKKYGY